MDKLDDIWKELSKQQYIYTKHNYTDVYNYTQNIEKIKQKAISIYCKEEKYNNIAHFESTYLNKDDNDRKLIDNEIKLIYQKLPEYILLSSQLRRVNKYKSKAFELLVKEILDNFFEELEPENTFLTIFKNLELEFKDNSNKYVSVTESFTIYDKNINKDKIIGWRLNKYNLDLAFLKNKEDKDNLIPIKSYIKGETINRDFFKSEKKYLFQINRISPVLRLNRNKNIFFYLREGEVKYKISTDFESLQAEILEEFKEDPSKTKISKFENYFIYTTPKDFLINYYIKSNFLESLENINNSHYDFKLKSMLKEYNFSQRPDLWTFENGKLIFFEVKFNEFTEFGEGNILNTINYVSKFNEICKISNINLRVYEINLIHINTIISPNIKKLVEYYEERGYKINLLNLKDIINLKNIEIPSMIKVIKHKSNTIREIEKSLYKPNNIVIDLTEVTK